MVKAFREFDDPRAQLQMWGGTGSRPVFEFIGKNMHEDPRIQVKEGMCIRTMGYSKVYGQMSVFVHPSLADGFGYVVFEAMACGRPVIVTENTGAADIVQDGINGFIVPIRDSQAILEKLHLLRNSPELRQKMGEAARISAQNLTFEKFRQNLRQAH
ncbi:MAG: glycosyltransferase [Verrucomicrobia bacterium]|nr:glycosyltransferase [Verrucomicrobiota bacterium]